MADHPKQDQIDAIRARVHSSEWWPHNWDSVNAITADNDRAALLAQVDWLQAELDARVGEALEMRQIVFDQIEKNTELIDKHRTALEAAWRDGETAGYRHGKFNQYQDNPYRVEEA